ncbi:MAG: response regulator [Dehalococcoidia bacterium]
MPDKPRVLIVDQDLRGRADLQQLLAKSRLIVVGGVGYDEEALALASELRPQVILVALEEPTAEPLQTVQSLINLLPKTPVIVYSSLGDMHSVRRARAAGAWDYLTKPFDLEQLTSCIERALDGQTGNVGSEETSPPELRRDGTVVTVFGAKGGVGKTLLAVNLAASMAELGLSPALVDLDSVFGDVARTMKIKVGWNFLEAAQHADELDEWTVDSYLSSHPCGAKVLPAPREPIDWREIDPQAVDRLITLLAKVHEFIVIDTPATFTDLVILALHRADIVLLLSSPDPASIGSTATVLNMLASSPSPPDRTRLVLNHPIPTSLLSDADAARELGREVFWSLPYDENIAYRDEDGRPVVLCRPKARISRSISKLASLLAEAKFAASSRTVRGNGSGLLSRVFGA